MKMEKTVLIVTLFQTLFFLAVFEGVMAFPQDVIYSDSNVAITPSSYVVGILILLISVIAFIGLFIGYILANKVKGRHMAIGSVVYWTVYLINLYLSYRYYYPREFLYQIPAFLTLSQLILMSGFLVSSLNVVYVIRKYTLRRHS